MRLLIVSQYFWPEHFRVNELATGLAARGHQVTVLTGLPNYPDGQIFDSYRADPGPFDRLGDVEIIRLPLLPRGRTAARLLLNYLSFVIFGLVLGPWKLRGRSFDAIFMFETSPITSAIPALLLRRLKRAPLLMWVLDLWPETLAAVGVIKSPRLLGWVGKLVAFIYERCDRILIQSHAFEANVRRYSRHPERLRYFPAWAEVSDDDGETEIAPELAPHRDGFNILFAGNIGEAQDFPSIVDAAAALRGHAGIQWLIVGSGRAEAALVEAIQARGLEDRVVLLGRHPVDRMPSFFRGADALLVSLRDDPIFAMTIPGKVQTYLASGVPILGMLNGEGARVIEEAGAGLTCPAGRGDLLAERVLDLMGRSPEERYRMGQRGRSYCQAEFDRDSLFTSLEEWILELTTSKGSCAPE